MGYETLRPLGIVEQAGRVRYRLTAEGRARASTGEPLGQSTLREYPAYLEYYRRMPSRQKGESASPGVEEADEAAELASSTPIDRIDAAVDELTAALEDRVYTALHQIEDPYDFEHLVRLRRPAGIRRRVRGDGAVR